MKNLNLRGQKLTGVELVEECDIGWTRWCTVYGAVPELMNLYVSEQAEKAKLWNIAKGFTSGLLKEAVSKLAPNRFVTFDEYQAIFDNRMAPSSSHDHFDKYPIYRILGISNEAQRREFCRTNSSGLEGYFKLMEKADPELWKFFFTWRKIRIPKKEKNKHAYIVAGTDSGKSEVLKSWIGEDINDNDAAIIVIDPDGDLAKEVVRFKENAQPFRKDKLVYIDPFLDHRRTPVINPFDLPDKEQYLTNYYLYKAVLEKRAGHIQAALMQIFDDLEAGFSAKMQSYLFPFICIVLLKPNSDLRDLLRFFTEGQNDDLIELGKRSPNENHRRDFMNGITVPKPTLEAARDKLRELLNTAGMQDLITGQSTIDLEAEIEQKKLIIFNLSEGELDDKVSLYYGKFVLSLVQSIIFKRSMVHKSQRTTLRLYVDEAEKYINDGTKKLLNRARKYKAFLRLASQYTGQGMSEKVRRAVASNTLIKVVGANQDTKTISETAAWLGMTTDEVKAIKKRTFIIKQDQNLPFEFRVGEKYLGDKNSMTSKEWITIKNEQREKYYRKINHDFRESQTRDKQKFNPKNKDEG